MTRLIRRLLLLIVVPILSCARPVATIAHGRTACSVQETASSDERCANLIPRKWNLDQFKNKDADNLLDFIEDIPLQTAQDRADRVAHVSCRDPQNVEDKKFPVTLRVPEDIRRMPATGTGGGSLVSAVFIADEDKGCREALYGHRARNKKGSDDWEIVAQFTVISTESSTEAGDVKKPIGVWRAYTISQKRKKWWLDEYRLDRKVVEGTLMLCQKEASHTDEVAYISCEQSSRLMHAVAEKSLPPGINSVDDALRAYKAGQPDVRRAAGAARDFSDSPGWMRCGDMGCCAMYGA